MGTHSTEGSSIPGPKCFKVKSWSAPEVITRNLKLTFVLMKKVLYFIHNKLTFSVVFFIRKCGVTLYIKGLINIIFYDAGVLYGMYQER